MDGLMQSDWKNDGSTLKVIQNPEVNIAGILEVVGIWTEPDLRRQGYATELLADVCREADRSHIVLMLRPEEYGKSQGLKKLEPWYKRFGFIRIQDNPVLMARKPR